MFTRAVIFSCYENEESIKINVMYSFHLYSLKGYSFLSINCSNEDFVTGRVKTRGILLRNMNSLNYLGIHFVFFECYTNFRRAHLQIQRS